MWVIFHARRRDGELAFEHKVFSEGYCAVTVGAGAVGGECGASSGARHGRLRRAARCERQAVAAWEIGRRSVMIS